MNGLCPTIYSTADTSMSKVNANAREIHRKTNADTKQMCSPSGTIINSTIDHYRNMES